MQGLNLLSLTEHAFDVKIWRSGYDRRSERRCVKSSLNNAYYLVYLDITSSSTIR